MLHLYLDYSPKAPHTKTGELVRKEYLGLYVHQPLKVVGKKAREVFDSNQLQNQLKQQHNQQQRQIAQQILNSRLNDLNKNEIYNHLERKALEAERRLQQSFLDFFEDQCRIKKARNYLAAFKYYNRFTKGKPIVFAEVTPEHCENFKQYLLEQAEAGKISNNTAAQYFNLFRIVVEAAERFDHIEKNPNKKVSTISLIPKEKEFLTQQEVQQLANTSCENNEVRRVALFATQTGFRRGDIEKLTWKNIRQFEGSWHVSKVVQKGKKLTWKPLNKTAVALLGEIQDTEEKIFKIKNRSWFNSRFKRWLKAAGIKKHVTFHILRHTAATNLFITGANLKDVSDFLDHSRTIITANTYVHTTKDRVKKAVQKLKINL